MPRTGHRLMVCPLCLNGSHMEMLMSSFQFCIGSQKLLRLPCIIVAIATLSLVFDGGGAQVNNILVSRASGDGGAIGNTMSDDPDMTPDGQVVVFESDATNLLPGLNGKRQVFLRNMGTSQLELVSKNLAGAP